MTKDGTNHFETACSKMAEGCPGIGMECGEEQATCGDDSVIWYGKENSASRRYQKMNEEKLSSKDDAMDDVQTSQEDSEDEAAVKEDEAEDEEEDKVEEQASLDDEDLPAGWEALWSKEYERMYYSNAETGEVTWTKPEKPVQPKRKAAVKTDKVDKPKEQADVVSRPHYENQVNYLHRHEHHIFSKGVIAAIVILCLTVCLASSSNETISSNTWSTIDAVVTAFLALGWYYVVMHFLEFAGYQGLWKLTMHLAIATALLLASSLISYNMKKRADRTNKGKESVDIFNSLFTPMVMWCNAGAVSTAQQLAKPSLFYVFLATVGMVLFYAVLAVFWYNTVDRLTTKGWSEDTVNKLTGGALAAGTVLWCHMLLVGSYQTIEDPHPDAPGFGKTLLLHCFSFLYIAIACTVKGPTDRLVANTDKGKQYVKWRAASILGVYVNWLPYLSCVKSLGHLIIDNLGYQQGAIESRLLVALVSTLIGTGLIILCAKVFRDTKGVVGGILIGLGGFMVGAAWAGLLNNSINQMVKGYKHPFVAKLEVTSLLTACVLPTYFFYLKPMIDKKTAS